MYACFMTRDRSTNERLNGKVKPRVKRIKQEVNYDVRNVHISRKVGQIQRRYTRAREYSLCVKSLLQRYNVT